MLVALFALAGLLTGSFLNVVIHRVPRGESVVEPASHCPACDHAVRWFDNIPVLSWIVLRGRCRDCRAPISPRYLVVEAATGASFAVIGAVTLDGTAASLTLSLTLCYAAAVGIALFLIDVAVHRLPDALTIPAVYVITTGLAVTAALAGDGDALVRAVLAGAGTYLFYIALAVAYPGGMGGGDAKLSASLGLILGWAGWGAVIIGTFASFVLAGLAVLALASVRRVGRKSRVAFGPWMILGCVVGLAAWVPIARWYLALLL